MLAKDVKDTGSVYADEGTAAHAVSAARLLGVPGPAAADVETSDYINVYTSAVRRAAEGKILLVEQHLNIERWTSEKGGKGTSDALIIDLDAGELEVWDLKFGAGHVVFAEDNEQLMLYALGALDVVETVYGEMQRIKLVICQPRRDHISEHVITRDDLIAFGAKAREAGNIAMGLLRDHNEPDVNVADWLHPSEKACLWCPVKATCPALEAMVQANVFDEFEVLDDGGVKAIVKSTSDETIPSDGVLTMIEQYVAAKRAWINERLKNRIPTPGWKLVQGKRGNRRWKDETKVEELLKRMKFKKSQTHEESLIPLTKIEKLVPKEKWPLFEVLITQPDGQPVAVPESDKRPEYTTATEEDFDAFT